jgi:hypothetical protein
VKRSLSSLSYSSASGNDSGLLGNSIELVIHIKREGFIVFVNRHFCVFFAHRREPEYFSSLLLTLPVLDDNGNEEQAIYHKVWWGICDPSLPFHEIPATVLLLASTYVVLFFCLHNTHRNKTFSFFFSHNSLFNEDFPLLSTFDAISLLSCTQ